MKILSVIILSVFVLLIGTAFADPVRVGYLQSDIHQLPLWVAIEKGYYDQERIKMEVAGIFKAGPELMTAFSAGALDIGYVGAAPATTAVANKTAKVTLLAQVNTEGSAIVVSKSRKVRTISALVGRTVAIPGYSTVQDFLLRKALRAFNIETGKVKIIVIKPPEMISALRTEQIDAFTAWEPYPAKAVSSDVGVFLATSGDIWKDHPCCVLAADSGFLDLHRDQAAGMVRAHVKAIEFIRQNRQEASAIAIKYTGMDELTIRLAMKNVNYTHVLSVDGIREYVEFLTRLKYVNITNVDKFMDLFVQPTFVAEALKK
jgi:NitT/TauT family transport system substrate-binding protein